MTKSSSNMWTRISKTRIMEKNTNEEWRPPHLTEQELYELQCEIDETSADCGEFWVQGNGQSNQLPTIISIMDKKTEKKKEQLMALVEKMKQDGKPIDWATAVLCWIPTRLAVNGRTHSYSVTRHCPQRKYASSVERSCTDKAHLLREGQTRNDWLHLPRMITSEHSMHLKQVHPSESLPLTMPFFLVPRFHH